MAKLRNVQFYRNTTVANVASHSVARTNAQTVFDGQIPSMQDGEMLLYRYTIGSDTTVHTITGVVRKTGTSTGYVEILANADMLSNAAFTGKAEDVTYSNSTSGLTATDVQGAIDEVEGRVDTLEGDVLYLNSTLGSVNAVTGIKFDDTLADVVNGIVTINTDDSYPYGISTNPLATVNGVVGRINDLNVSTDTGAASISGSTITINAVQQEKGKIKDGGSTTISLDGSYNETNNKIATQDTVKNAVVSLNSTAGIASLADEQVTIYKTVNEVSGLIHSTSSDDKIVLAKVAYNATAGYVSILDENSKFAATNVEDALYELKGDIAGLAGGMRYNGGISAAVATRNTSTNDVRPGDIYLATGAFTIDGQSVEAGDMIIYKGNTSQSDVALTASNCNVIEKETDTMVTTRDSALTDDYLIFGDGNKQISINATAGGADWQLTATNLKSGLDKAGTALQSISEGTNSAYANAVVGTKDNNNQTVAVHLDYAVVNTEMGVTTAGILNSGNIANIKTYIDNKVGTAVQSVSEGTDTNDNFVTVDLKVDNTDPANPEIHTETAVTYGSSSVSGDDVVIVNGVAGMAQANELITNRLSLLDANKTSDDAAVATVTVNEVNGKITDVIVATNAISVNATDLSVNSTTGAVTGDNIANIKTYIDNKVAGSTLQAGDGIAIDSTTDPDTVSVDPALNSTVGTTATPSSTTPNLLKIDSDGKLSISDTWDCGEY